ncbi:MAG: phage terminase large subunit [Plesiomonas shigelloides]
MAPTLNPQLRDFWFTRNAPDGNPVRYRTLYGGRMSSKSHDAAGVAIARANHHTERFLCLRMYQNRIADSVYTLLKDKIYYFGLESQFKIFADAIEHKTNGSLFRFYGCARNVDEIKSFEGATVAWWEEAHNMTENMFTTVRPTVMRNEGAEMWFTFNPRFATDYAYKRLVVSPPAGSLIRQINYDENPFLTASALADIRSAFDEDWELANHIYNGVPLDNDDRVVIKRSWLVAAIDAHKTVTPSGGSWFGGKTVGYDVADDGDDKNATTSMDGSVCIGLDEWRGGEDQLRESAARVKQTAETVGASHIGYDSIGVGAGTGSHLNSLGWRRHFKFNAGAKVADPKRQYADTRIANEDFFANLKAQTWWLTADRFRNTFLAVSKGRSFPADQMISLDSSRIDAKLLDKLVDELSTPMRDFDNAGKVKVESKKDLAKREIASPNVADSFIIANSRGMLARRSLSEIL